METVVITGLGACTPLGANLASTWEKLISGKSGVRYLPPDWSAKLPVKIAAPLTIAPETEINRVQARRLDRFTQIALIAAKEAWMDAGFSLTTENNLDPNRLSVVVGSSIGGLDSLVSNWDSFRENGNRQVSPFTIPMLMINAAAANVGLLVGAKASIHSPVSACASGNEAIGLGLDLIRLGRAEIVLVGGAEATIHPLALAAFARMQALSRQIVAPETASRPWDTQRDGFVMAEGAGILVLESLSHAKARNARIYGTLAGVGITTDSHHIVQPEPNGHSQAIAMINAIQDANLTSSDIKHVNAHATSTPLGDRIEAKSIAQALALNTHDAIVTAPKSMTGHMLGAAGALEAIITVKSLFHRIVPATINISELEPDLDIDVALTNRKLPNTDLAAINNSFGFGGHNVVTCFTNANATANTVS